MESRTFEISALARVCAMFLDWATVPNLALPMPTITSAGASLLALAILEGIPPEAGGFFVAHPKRTATKQTAKTIPMIFFIKTLLENILSS
jgi:hypothetical protein